MENIVEYEEGHGIVIVFVKLFMFLLGLSATSVNVVAFFEFNAYTPLFPEFENAEFTSEIAVFGVMIALVSLYGSLLYYVEDLPDYRQSLTVALKSFLIWEISLSIILLATLFTTVYCYFSVEYIFEGGFFNVMVDYRKKPELAALMNSIQESYCCCGNYNYTEWYQIQWSPVIDAQTIAIPESCCNVIYSEVMNMTCQWKALYNETYKLFPYKIGCLDVIKWWYSFYFIISTLLFFLAFLSHGLCLGLTFIMFMSKRRSYTTLEKKKLIFQQGALFQAAMESGLENQLSGSF